jgi:hypothetical protein
VQVNITRKASNKIVVVVVENAREEEREKNKNLDNLDSKVVVWRGNQGAKD